MSEEKSTLTAKEIEESKQEKRDAAKDAINDALIEFVLRVVKDPCAKPEEVQILPEIIKILFELLKPRPIERVNFGGGIGYTDKYQ